MSGGLFAGCTRLSVGQSPENKPRRTGSGLYSAVNGRLSQFKNSETRRREGVLNTLQKTTVDYPRFMTELYAGQKTENKRRNTQCVDCPPLFSKGEQKIPVLKI
jgi:hypothetical protein